MMGTRTDRRLDGWEKNIGHDKCGRRRGVLLYRGKRNGDKKNGKDKENFIPPNYYPPIANFPWSVK